MEDSHTWMRNMRYKLRFHQINDLEFIGTSKIYSLYGFHFHCSTHNDDLLVRKHKIIIDISYNDENKEKLENFKKDKKTVYLTMNDINIFDNNLPVNLESLPEPVQIIIRSIYVDAETVHEIFKN